jgi:hypothetical protein
MNSASWPHQLPPLSRSSPVLPTLFCFTAYSASAARESWTESTSGVAAEVRELTNKLRLAEEKNATLLQEKQKLENCLQAAKNVRIMGLLVARVLSLSDSFR